MESNNTETQVERLLNRDLYNFYYTCMESLGLKLEDVINRTNWKTEIQSYSGDPRWWEHLGRRITTNDYIEASYY